MHSAVAPAATRVAWAHDPLLAGIFAGMYEVPEILRLQAAHEADLAGGTPGSRGPMWPVLRHPALFSLLVT